MTGLNTHDLFGGMAFDAAGFTENGDREESELLKVWAA